MNPRLTLAAALSVGIIGGTVATLDANRPEAHYRISVDAGECVIPDCRTYLGRGPWDDRHAPVDCLATGPYAGGVDGGVWRGCTVFLAEYATGTACLPARCSVVAGEDPLEVLP